MTSKNSVDTIIYEILKEIPDRDTICALDFGLISLAVQQAIEDGGIPKPDHKLTSEEWAALQGDAFREAMTTSTLFERACTGDLLIDCITFQPRANAEDAYKKL
jgi:hypothetical protein